MDRKRKRIRTSYAADSAAELAQRWRDWLRKYVRMRAAQEIDAEKLAQELYLRLLKVPQWQATPDPERHFFRMANHIISEWRQEPRLIGPTDPLDRGYSRGSNSAHIESQASIPRAELRRALDGLSPPERAVLLLYFRDRRTCSHVARALGRPERAIRRYLVQGAGELLAASSSWSRWSVLCVPGVSLAAASRSTITQAARWWVLLHGGRARRLTAGRVFAAWVAESPTRIEAYLRIAVLLDALSTAGAAWSNRGEAALVNQARDERAAPVAFPEYRAGRTCHSRSVRPPASARRRRLIGAVLVMSGILSLWLWSGT